MGQPPNFEDLQEGLRLPPTPLAAWNPEVPRSDWRVGVTQLFLKAAHRDALEAAFVCLEIA